MINTKFKMNLLMRITKIFSFIVVLSFLFIACKEKKTAEKVEKVAEKTIISPANLQTTNIAIEGMTCAIGCAKTIEEKLTDLKGVQKATVNFDNKKATIVFDKTVQTQETLVNEIEATGDGKTYTAVLTK